MKDKKKAEGAALELASKKTTTDAAAGFEVAGKKTTSLPFYPVELDGKTYKLCFDLGELAKAEREFEREGHQVNMLFALNPGSIDLDAVESLFAATVRTYHPELKYSDAVKLITLSSVYRIATVILEALATEHRGAVEIEDGAGGGETSSPNQEETLALTALAVPAVVPFITLPLNDESEFPISDEQILAWQALYPAIDVKQQVRKYKGWADANPTKRKTRRGILASVNTWLAKTTAPTARLSEQQAQVMVGD